MADLQSIHIVPTYACNLACDYCYASKYIGRFPRMRWATFRRVLDRLIASNVRHVIFIGGEPTIWGNLSRAIDAARGAGMSVTLLSNAMRLPDSLPDAVTVNGTNLGIDRLRPTILKNLQAYRLRGVSITLRFNLRHDETDARLAEYAGYAAAFADGVSLSPIVPYPLTRRVGEIVVDLSKRIVAQGKPVKLSRALPRCIFTPAERTFLTTHAGLYHRCSPANKQLTVNPDGSILPCVDLPIPRRTSTDDLNAFKKTFAPTLDELFMKATFDKCKTCKYFPKVCQGGCLTMRCAT